MERHDESLSTRDLAGTAHEAPVESVDEPGTSSEQASPAPAATEPEAAAMQAQPAMQDDRALQSDRAIQDDPDRMRAGVEDIDEAGSLLPDGEESDFQRRWEEIQTRFVDDPRQAVEDADALVAGVMQRIAEGFAQARDGLEGQWSRGEDVGTEELRVALQRYRAFFRRLLSA
jgi:hypothetical protein